MMRLVRKRLTYANVMSSIAVFLVTAAKIKKNAVNTAKIKNEAVRPGKLANGSVVTNKLADGAVTGAKVDESSLSTVPSADKANSATKADTATSATTATSAETAASLEKLYFAVVKSDGSLARGTAGVTSEPSGENAYRVFLPAGTDTKTCFFVGSLGGQNSGNEELGQISLNPSGIANAIFITTAKSDGSKEAKEFTVMAALLSAWTIRVGWAEVSMPLASASARGTEAELAARPGAVDSNPPA